MWATYNISLENRMYHIDNFKRFSQTLKIRFYTTFTNFSMEYLVMYKVYTDVYGIK